MDWKPHSDSDVVNRLIVGLEQDLLQVVQKRQEISWLVNQPGFSQLCEWIDAHPFDAFAFSRIKSGHAMTPRHAINVMLLVRAWSSHAHKLGDKLNALTRASLFHDLGHWEHPDLLFVFAPFSKQQMRDCQKHPDTSWAGLTAEERAWIAEHHEQPDGRGYPRGITKVNPIAQLIHVCDVFDGLTTPRRFRKTFSYADAMTLMARWSGHVFPKGLFRSFQQFFGAVPVGTFIREPKGPLCVSIPGHKVLVLTEPNGESLAEEACYVSSFPKTFEVAPSWRSVALPGVWRGLRPDLLELPRAYFEEP